MASKKTKEERELLNMLESFRKEFEIEFAFGLNMATLETVVRKGLWRVRAEKNQQAKATG
jgi:hypothetical protein